ncbi:MAG TPA: PEFG-CTERM sorting domain-containing protein [Nitrosopumilaceae archaeon]|nr:PEFG-CTERM sorting domain-containing protein [Nitrosopumilaceae archaeon]
MRYFIFPIIALFVLSIWCIPSFAQTTAPTSPNITVTTDKSSYTINDSIVISGVVKAVVPRTPVTIQIFNADKNVVYINQIDVSQDGTYSNANIKAEGKLWVSSGTYTVKVQYGPTVTTQTTFTFASSITPVSNYFIVKDPSSQQTFSVNYTISGGTVKDMTIDTQSISLITSLNSTSCNVNCDITLQIPRSLIDAKTTNGQDDSFIVLIDGAEVPPSSEETNNSFRTLTIQFLQGDQDVEIIGTWIVPEFGTIAMLVLAIAIISIIAVSAKTGLRFMPKY